MTNIQMLQAYRDAVLDMQELAFQLERISRSGAPSGARSMTLDAPRGTNAPEAAALQAADGIEEMLTRKRGELAALATYVGPLVAQIAPYKTYMVIQQYYLHGLTDSDIARNMCMSRSRVNQLRRDYLASVS